MPVVFRLIGRKGELAADTHSIETARQVAAGLEPAAVSWTKFAAIPVKTAIQADGGCASASRIKP